MKKERPILFSSLMVQAILGGRKTQTRRIIKKQPKRLLFPCGTGKKYWAYDPHDLRADYYHHNFGEVGDILWVRESWHYSEHKEIPYLRVSYKATPDNGDNGAKWKPSIFMPKQFSRIKLEIIDIRVEKLCDISEEDAMAEGINLPNYAEQAIKDIKYPEPSDIYAELWDEINGTGSWIKNPWVWVIEFKSMKKNK